jgi:hypothetical protein
MELLKSFRYLTNDTQISEVKELLHFYFTHKLEAAIDVEEGGRNYTSAVFEKWLKAKSSNSH